MEKLYHKKKYLSLTMLWRFKWKILESFENHW